MSSPAYLSLLLDAPLQSWGYQSRFDRRTSLSYPTRSGIVGMLCAAMGIDRSDAQGLGQFSDLKMTVYVFSGAGRLMDFHTVGGGWERKTDRQNIVPKADGSVGDTVVTHREFLQNAKFGMILHGDQALLGSIAMALQNPRWGMWLGRKACIPASPVFQGVHDSEALALQSLRRRVGPDCKVRSITREVDRFEDGTDTLMDVPLNFAQREFTPRRVCVEPPGGD
jgi:CRISPR system Cascade subunit CasD